ncbi:39S ribosomal protein L12, mitochondrial [Maniola jurtina]|uniref:39S ribosomal protein L12, mitochondrial n=1 Tax=Maniola jurtina TaxID=191418 RepID=UPI001E68E3D5|nr:39S ribosomal protein L12, mitochondrial [Maniola jurtina]XP_045771814.1 39S ribosomal protein L12, mitochondrial [Maniola jurtina]
MIYTVMNSFKLVRKVSARTWRSFSRCTVLQQEVSEAISPLIIPPPEGVDKPVSPKIEKIVTDITNLNLLEVSELSQVLKRRLNLPDAPMMPMGGFAAMAAPAAQDEEEAAPKAVKTSFTVKMTKYDDKQKVALIKEVKSLLEGFNLVQAKKFVESVPTVVKADISKDEAEKLKEALSKVGAVIEID